MANSSVDCSNEGGFTTADLLRTVLELPHPSRYWVAFSGGVDSTCLLHSLANLRKSLPAPVHAIHVDHGLQADSSKWSVHCQRICAELGIEFVTRSLHLRPQPGESIEAVARQERLAVYREVLGVNGMLLTAQHQDDQAETVLLQLLRGAGLPGLAAMPKLMPMPPGWLARPLLGITRKQIHAYAKVNNLTWVEDPSNMDINFDRNYLRQRIMPMLAQRWPACDSTIARSANHCAEAMELITDLVAKDCVASQGSKPNTLSVSALLALKPNLCRSVLRYWIHNQGFSTPSTVILARINHELLTAAPDRSPLIKWQGVEIRRYRDDVFALKPLPSLPIIAIAWPQGNVCNLPTGLGQLYYIPSGTGSGLDPACLTQDGLEVHFRVSGAHCCLNGIGHRLKLKNLYQDRGIPDWLRPYVPLVYLKGKLIAVAGFFVCDKVITTGGVEFVWDSPMLRDLRATRLEP